MLDRMRWRLALSYVVIFALILLLLLTAAVVGFSRELTTQQDILLTQEARDQARNLLDGENREVLAEGSADFSWVALDPGGRVTDRDPSADTLGTLGLPSTELAEQARKADDVVSDTIRGPEGRVRVVSMPMYEADEVVGTIQYARSLRGPQRTVNKLVLVLLPLALGGLGLTILGGLYVAGRAVRPVRDSFERQKAFVADASHELKTPLTLIRADAEVVLYRGEVTSRDRGLIEHALAETDHMNAILSSLLTLARLDAGQVKVSRKPLDLTAILVETAERFGARAASEEIRLEVRVPDKISALGDLEKTGEILAALLDNALRHTPPGGSVTLTGAMRNGLAEAVVRDTGPGIPPDHLSRIFERFYRVSDGRTRESGGTGLGLTIARDLARAQGGDLRAENSKEGGAVFHLRLPNG